MSLNKFIAKSHLRSRQLPALMITYMNYIAIALSMGAIALGILIYGIMAVPHDNTIVLILFIGALLLMGGCVSILIEGLTTTNCAALRTILKESAEIKKRVNGVDTQGDKELEAEKQRILNEVTWKVRMSTAAIAFTTIISTVGATMFWHYVFQDMHNDLLSWTVSTSFSIIVSTALIYSELQKDTHDTIVELAVTQTSLLDQASKASHRERILEIMDGGIDSAIDREEGNTHGVLAEAQRQRAYKEMDDVIGGGGTIQLKLEEQKRERDAHSAMAKQKLLGTDTSIFIPDSATGYKNEKKKNIEKIVSHIQVNGYPSGSQAVNSLASSLGVSSQTVYRYLEEIKG
jgi:hypothetical protein